MMTSAAQPQPTTAMVMPSSQLPPPPSPPLSTQLRNSNPPTSATAFPSPSPSPSSSSSSASSSRSVQPQTYIEQTPPPPTPPTTTQVPNQSEACSRKTRTPKDVAKRLFEQAISSSSNRSRKRRSAYTPVIPDFAMLSPPPTGVQRVIGGGNSGIPSHHVQCSPRSSNASATISRRRSNTVDNPMCLSTLTGPVPLYEKPQASSSGRAVTMTIQLAEPIMYLQGLDGSEQNRRPALLRGSLVLRVTKPTKIKAVSLTFKGRARTEWPEGIPPKKSEYFEEKEIMQHTWPFFNAQFITAELGHCADSFHPGKTASTFSCEGGGTIGSAISHLPWPASPSLSEHKNTLRITQSRSFSKGEALHKQMSIAQRGYRIFQPGDYAYNFELPLDSCLPETLAVELGSVKYELEGVIERPGAFRPNLAGRKEVVLVRVPSEANLEQTEPIAISRTWEDQLHYDIVISGKAFPLGTSIPIAFKLTPLAKVRCHRIKIFITENIEYSCKNRKVHRLDPVKKVQLFEKRAESHATSAFAGSSVRVTSGGGLTAAHTDNEDLINGTDNLLGNLQGAADIGPTEMEFNVQLPGCNAKERDRIHFDTTYGNIQVHHWIKIVMRLSKQDPADPAKRRHFEISIDSPFHILSCQANNANTTLPAYGEPLLSGPASLGSCTCPHSRRETRAGGAGAAALPQRNPHVLPFGAGNQIPAMNGIDRPMHLIRRPSTNPPAFNDDVPPPLVTPPPRYESVVDDPDGLAGYFSRLAAAQEEEYDTDDDVPGEMPQGRTLLPLTPGGRMARSMDERRTW